MSAVNTVRRYGPGAVLVTPGAGGSPADLAAAIAAAGHSDVGEVVPAAATVLVMLRAWASPDAFTDWLGDVAVSVGGSETDETNCRELVEIDVAYDGADLADVASATGLTVDEVVARHSEGVYRCEFCGFAPGFAYLGGLHPSLVLPRRATPRTSVPAGSVAIAGPYSAVYPTDSPGGWHLLGRTHRQLWDVGVARPALITPGASVRFRPIPRRTSNWAPKVANTAPTAPRSPVQKDRGQIEGPRGVLRVISPGWATSFQDAGRPGLAAIGVPAAGALDGSRRDLVNRLVGNVGEEAVIETAGGLQIEAVSPAVIADSSTGVVRTLAPGDSVDLDPREDEMWAYLGIRGGFAVEPVLGSRSWDSLSRLGPPPPQPGDGLAVGPDPRTALATDHAPAAGHRAGATIRVWSGPRLDWFVDGTFDALVESPWTVSADTSRVGVRLRGPRLSRRPDTAEPELPSEGLVTGAIQVPPDGQPVVMLADHPTTGGYPVVGVVDDRDLAALAQSRPGTVVHMRRASG